MLKAADNPEGVDAAVFDEMMAAIKTDRAEFFGSFFKDFFGVGVISHPVSQETLDWARGMAMQASLKATLDCVTAFSHTDFRPDLAAFKVPTLVIHGTDDHTVPLDLTGRAAARGIAESTLIEYDGAPHGLFVTDKDRLSNDLIAFLRA